VAGAGDVDNDGVPDYIVGAAEDGAVFQEREGYVKVFSGATGNLIRSHAGEDLIDRFGAAVTGAGNTSPGDDDSDDYAVGAHNHGTVGADLRGKIYLYSGATGGLRWSVDGAAAEDELGFSLAGGHDVNGDGIPDIVAGAPRSDVGASSGGYVIVLSGADGSEIHRIDGTLANGRLGLSVCSPGNLNPGADSRADFVAGSLNEGVKVYSGSTGAVLYALSGQQSSDNYGFSVAGMGDVTGDGVPEIIIGAPQGNFLFPAPGYVEVRNGANGALVFRNTGIVDGQNYGRQVSSAGDWNADGFDDVMIASIPQDSSINIEVDIVSGIDGAWLATLSNGVSAEREGEAIASVGDTDGDGRIEVLLGAPSGSDGGFHSGRAVLYESMDQVLPGCVGGSSNFCTSLPNSDGGVASLSLIGSTNVVDNDIVLVSTGLPTNQPGVFYYGNATMNVPFGSGIRCVGGNSIKRIGLAQTGPAGLAAVALDLPSTLGSNVAISGESTWYFQFWFRDPDGGGVNFSDGLQIDFCD